MWTTSSRTISACLLSALLLTACGGGDEQATMTDEATDIVSPIDDGSSNPGAEPAADGAGASQDNPVPLGQAATFGQAAFGVWEITVTGVNLDAEDTDDRLQEGQRRVEVSVTFSNRSSDKTLSPATALNQSGAADTHTQYALAGDSCGVPMEVEFSNPMINLAPGESSQAVMCWHAQEVNIDTLTVFFAPFHDKDHKIWFALR